jgi:Mn-dependent DtxR family transcriptional regulator
MASPSQEDYIEAIWVLIEAKGYARVSAIADRLGISPASVSKMVRRLHAAGLVIYERYRGLDLTPAGREAGQRLLARHRILEAFLQQLGLTDRAEILRTVEGVEHHFGPEALRRLDLLVRLGWQDPEWWQRYRHVADAAAPPPS